MKLQNLAVLFLVSLILLLPGKIFTQDCDAILKAGIYDVYSNVSSSERALAYINWFKENDFASLEQAKSASLNALVPIGEVLAKVGLSYDEHGYQEFRRKIQSYQNFTENEKSQIETHISSINANVVRAWENCTLSSGMHFWLVYTSDPKVFRIMARYNDDGSHSRPRLQSLQFTPQNVNITSGVFFRNRNTINRMVFTGATVAQSFVRRDSEQVAIDLNCTVGPGLHTHISQIKKSKPYIRYFISSPERINEGQPATLSWSIANAKTIFITPNIGDQPVNGTFVVKPNDDVTYTLTASNEIGENETRTLLIPVVHPVLDGAKVRFRTTGNDKDWNTEIEVFIKDSQGRDVSYTHRGPGQKYDNDTESPWEVLNINTPVQKSLIQTGRVTIKIKASGNDKWKAHPSVYLHFSDGDSFESGWLGGDRDMESRNSNWSGDNDWGFSR